MSLGLMIGFYFMGCLTMCSVIFPHTYFVPTLLATLGCFWLASKANK